MALVYENDDDDVDVKQDIPHEKFNLSFSLKTSEEDEEKFLLTHHHGCFLPSPPLNIN